jgi:hypothetical protein
MAKREGITTRFYPFHKRRCNLSHMGPLNYLHRTFQCFLPATFALECSFRNVLINKPREKAPQVPVCIILKIYIWNPSSALTSPNKQQGLHITQLLLPLLGGQDRKLADDMIYNMWYIYIYTPNLEWKLVRKATDWIPLTKLESNRKDDMRCGQTDAWKQWIANRSH